MSDGLRDRFEAAASAFFRLEQSSMSDELRDRLEAAARVFLASRAKATEGSLLFEEAKALVRAAGGRVYGTPTDSGNSREVLLSEPDRLTFDAAQVVALDYVPDYALGDRVLDLVARASEAGARARDDRVVFSRMIVDDPDALHLVATLLAR